MKAKAPLARCDDCPLRNRAFVPSSVPKGGKAPIAVVGEAPGRTEAVKGEPFIGPSGELLWAALNAVDIKREDTLVTNTVLCFPGTDEVPLEAVMCCRDRLMAELAKSETKHVLALGNEAQAVFTGEDVAISVARGRWRANGGRDEAPREMWVLPTFHPAYILRSPSSGPEFLRDVEKFARKSPAPFIPTETVFWHYPDSKMRKWIEPGLSKVRDAAEREWLQAYCVRQGIEWVESDDLLDNKAALRLAASRMVREIVSDLRYLTMEAWDGHAVIAIDLETTGYSPFADRILQLSLSWDVGRALVISGGLLWQKDVRQALEGLFVTNGITWVGHNGKFDMKFLVKQLGIAPKLTDDTFIMHSALDERSQLSRHALKPLVSQYFDVEDYEQETIKRYLPSKKTSFANVPPQLLGEYAGMDTDYTRRLWFELRRELDDEPGVADLYRKRLMPAVRAFIPVELHGIRVDWRRLTHVAVFLERKERQALERLRVLVDDPTFNPNSHVQVKRVLWDEKDYTPPRIRGQRSQTTRKEALMMLADEHPEDEFLSLLMDVRRYRKLMSSYVRNIHKYEDDNGRVHPVFNVTGTEVGRLSASDPAIQTIPRAYEPTGKLIRDFYVASEGYVLVYGDYSQAELRCAALLAQDEFLLKVYKEGRDLHSEVALSMYGPNFTKEQRNICKMFNFAYLYGGTEYSFAFEAGIDVAEASRWVKQYNRLLTGLSTWRTTQFQKLLDDGYVESPTGRRRRFPLILDANVTDAKKAVVHAPCAGTASDLTLAAFVELQRTTPEDVFPLLTVHDSNVVECPDDDERIAEVAETLRKAMEQSARDVFRGKIPFDVDVEVGYRWGSLVAYDGTPAWREKIDRRPLLEQTEFLARMDHVVCPSCGRWNPPEEQRKPSEVRCLTCKEELK